jgi:hypothetical protein
VKNETIKDLRTDLLWLADQLHMTATDLRLEANKIEYRDKRIEDLEAALFSIYVAPNDIPFIKSQIESVLDVNECRQKWGKKKDEQTP